MPCQKYQIAKEPVSESTGSAGRKARVMLAPNSVTDMLP